MTIKISDLSVGDWVQVLLCKCDYDEPDTFKAKVLTVVNNSVGVGYDNSGIVMSAFVEDLQPIPITAEILKKNGLVRHKRDSDNPELIVLSNHFIMARTWTDVDWWRVLIYDEELPSRELFNGRIYSVHQLQHALRLAGIDKEINL